MDLAANLPGSRTPNSKLWDHSLSTEILDRQPVELQCLGTKPEILSNFGELIQSKPQSQITIQYPMATVRPMGYPHRDEPIVEQCRKRKLTDRQLPHLAGNSIHFLWLA
mmetsp:Transcript_19711/g.78342  ORF Transcript_19711/g.78342 Transcript_19711/m.78342 type:complete len:109 (-) Transcript_19711:89-415(-)